MPELFSMLRPLIDENRRAASFILLGSAQPAGARWNRIVFLPYTKGAECDLVLMKGLTPISALK